MRFESLGAMGDGADRAYDGKGETKIIFSIATQT
jgi:hypothetical protein